MILIKCSGEHTLRIAAGITVLALLLTGNANAANFTVCPSGCAYSSIQSAIDSASSGDTIEVQSCTYFENVVVNKSLNLKGVGSTIVKVLILE